MPNLQINGNSAYYVELGSGDPFIYLAYTRFDSADYWVDYMAQHARDFRVIMPDARGMGKSQHTAMIEPQDWVDDLLELFTKLDLPPVHLAAETLGSRVAARFAADHPERVKTLILNGAIGWSSPEGDAARAASADPEKLPQARRDLMQRLHGDDFIAVNRFYQDLHDREDFKEFYDLRVVSSRVKAPTLILRGDIDEPIHPVEHSVAVHKATPDSWLSIFPNCEFNALRGCPEDSWNLIRRFIAAKGS